jgi:tRNA threonylcarbamoyladenosine biosynthesis protein TsaE
MIVPAEDDFSLDAEADTVRLGAAIGKALEKGEAVCLTGPLGAGKSVLARALIRARAPGERDVPSPTYTLVQFYETPGLRIGHFDLYRIADAAEAFEIGLDEALEEGAAVIEWAERLGHRLPADRLDIEIALDEGRRYARLTPHGAWEGRPIAL